MKLLIDMNLSPKRVDFLISSSPISSPAPTATWPPTLPEQIAALATLAALGRARQLEDGRWLG